MEGAHQLGLSPQPHKCGEKQKNSEEPLNNSQLEQLLGLGTLKAAPDKANSFKSCILGGLEHPGAPGYQNGEGNTKWRGKHQNGEENTRSGGRMGENGENWG